jgi:hypothetical protein
MTDIEQKALALWNEVRAEREYTYQHTSINRATDMAEALCRAIEQHEAFRKEVSDAAEVYEEMGCPMGWEGFEQFIIRKPDPLVKIMEGLDGEWTPDEYANAIRAALDAAGFEIREQGQ